MQDDRHIAPFPSRGKGRGWGGGTSPQDVARKASSKVGPSPSACGDEQPASTPSQSFPLEGKGYERFAGPDRVKPGGVRRGQRLRAAPTFVEAKLWERLRKLGIRIRRQASIGGYVVDFACLRAKLVIEVDGGIHERTDVAVRDLERDSWLSAQGFRVLRIPNGRVEKDIEAVVGEIEAAIRASVPNLKQPAPTPSQPFPLEGKGLSEF